MVAPIRFLSGRQQQQKIGVIGSTEDTKVLEVIGRVGIGTTIFDSTTELDIRGNTHMSGKLGIGITNPASKLDINGTLNVSGVSTFTTSDTINQPWPISRGDGTAIRIKATTLSSYDSSGNGDVSGLDAAYHTKGKFPANVSIANTLGTAGINFSDGDLSIENVGSPQYSGSFAIFARNSTYANADNFIWASPSNGIHVGYSTGGGGVGGSPPTGGFAIKKTKTNGNGDPTEIFKIDGGTDDLIFSGENVGIGSAIPTAKLDVVGLTELDNLNVSGIATIGTFGVSGLSTTNQLKVVGLSTFESNVDINASVDISNNLTVDGLSDLDELYVAGIATFRNNVEFFGPSSVQLTWDSVEDILKFKDDVAAYFGDGDDLKIFHNGSDSYISDGGVGNLNIISNGLGVVIQKSGTESIANFNTDGSVELYYDNSKKFETTGYGVTVSGGLNVSGVSTFQDNVTFVGAFQTDSDLTWDKSSSRLSFEDEAQLSFGDNSDLFIYHTNGGTSLPATTTPGTYILAQHHDLIISAGNSRSVKISNSGPGTLALFDDIDDNVELYYQGGSGSDNGKKFETIGYGISVYGGINASGISTFQDEVYFKDNVNVINDKRITVGTGITNNCLRLYYDTFGTKPFNNEPYIEGLNTNLNIQVGSGKTFRITHAGFIQGPLAQFTDDKGVELYYGAGGTNPSSKKFETTGVGVSIVNGTSDTATIYGPSNLIIDPMPIGVNTFVSIASTEGTIGIGTDIITGISTDGITEGILIQNQFVPEGTTVVSIGQSELGIGTTTTNVGIETGLFEFGNISSGIVRIKGDLYVDGTQFVVASSTIELADFVVGIATTVPNDILLDGAGIGIGTNKTFLYEYNSGTNPSLKSSENLNVDSGKHYQIGEIEVLNATTLGSGVTISSLTQVGTINTGVWQGTQINDDYLGTIDNANKVSLNALNIDGGTDIGAPIVDGDLFIVDDGANGTNRKADVIGLTTYTFGKVSGDIVISATGVATIQANSVALGGDTTGQYASTITGGSGLTATTPNADDATAYTIDVGAGTGITVNADDVAIKNADNLTDNKVVKWDDGNGQLTDSVITDDGTNVGIGSTQPTAKLDVNGTLNVSGITTTGTLYVGAAGTIGITSILDEDDMVSDSDTALATQQSIKTYVDTLVDAQDLDFAGDTGTGAVDLDDQSFTIAGTANEIETSASNQTLTIGLPNDVAITTSLVVGSATTITGSGIVAGIVTGTLDNTLTLATSGNGLTGSATYDNSGAATFTVTSDATSANTADTIVYRDASGDFSAGTITANLTGTATTATNLADGANITTGTISDDRLPDLITSNINIASGISSVATLDATNATIDNLTFTSGTAITSVDTDLTTVSGSDDTLASAKAIKTYVDAYVDAQVTAQDLDFAGDIGTGAVDLDSQSLTISGTVSEIETSASGQTLTIGLPNQVAITTSLVVGSGVTITGSTVQVGGTITELYNGTFWNVVTQADVGYGASQVPLNQYLGQLAFLDDYHPNGLRRDGGGSDDVFVDSNGLVGINTTSPTSTLDVNGTLNVAGIATFNTDVEFVGSTAGVTSAYWDSSANLLNFKDDVKATFGDGDDLQIYHDATNSYIDNTTGDLWIRTVSPGDDINVRSADDITIQNNGGTNAAIFKGGAGAWLYYNGDLKFETTGYGVTVSGGVYVSGISTFQDNIEVTGNIEFDNITTTGAATTTLTTLTETPIHTGLSTSTYRSVEYTIQATEGTNFHSAKVLVVHDGTTAYHSEYGTIYNNTPVATFNADVSGGNLRLLASGASASSTVYKIYFVATKV